VKRNLDNPKLLILETSGRIGRIALADGTGLGEVRTLDETRRHGRDLAPAVAALCAERGWSVCDLDGVIASIGPGSYTGLRVGLMSAKVLAYATGCMVLGIETFAAIANQTPAGVDRVAVIADAQQQQVYAQTWSRNGDKWTAVGPMVIRPFADWITALDEGVWISGPAVQLFESQWTDRKPRVPPESCDPMPASLLKLGLQRWRAGESDDPATIGPLYLRPSNAEENWDKRGKALGHDQSSR
jgi:tRNA threonylcarbamoyladenosine biosynthesis protein TsaB